MLFYPKTTKKLLFEASHIILRSKKKEPPELKCGWFKISILRHQIMMLKDLTL